MTPYNTRLRQQELDYRDFCQQNWPAAQRLAAQQCRAQASAAFVWVFPPERMKRFDDTFYRDYTAGRRTLTEWPQAAAERIVSFIREFCEALKKTPRHTLDSFLGVDKKVAKAGGKRLQRAGAHHHNLELAWFVVERIIPFAQLLQGDLMPGRHLPTQRPLWDLLYDEWNRTHPHPLEQKNSGETLSREYRRAVSLTEKGKRRLTHLGRELVLQVRSDYDEAQCEADRGLESMRQWYAGLTEEQRAQRFGAPIRIRIPEEDLEKLREAEQKLREVQRERREFLETLSPEKREAFEEQSAQRERERIQRERDVLTRKDLIAHRAFHLIFLGDFLRNRGRFHELDAPLRAWFLPEARGEQLPLFAHPEMLTGRLPGRNRMGPAPEPPTSPPRPRRSRKSAPPDAKPARPGRTSRRSR
jgi:hypothetical protein